MTWLQGHFAGWGRLSYRQGRFDARITPARSRPLPAHELQCTASHWPFLNGEGGSGDLLLTDDEASGRWPPVGSRLGRETVWGSGPPSSARVGEPARRWLGFETRRAGNRWGSGPPPTAMDDEPAGEQAPA
jgi:hypothetical protein